MFAFAQRLAARDLNVAGFESRWADFARWRLVLYNDKETHAVSVTFDGGTRILEIAVAPRERNTSPGRFKTEFEQTLDRTQDAFTVAETYLAGGT